MPSKLVAVAALLAAGVSTAQAEGFNWVGTGALTVGGEELVKVRFDDGTTKKITSGGFMQFSIGMEYTFPETPYTIHTTFGIHFDNASATNGSVEFSRTPVELICLYHLNEKIRLGAGLRKTYSPELTSSGDIDIGDYTMNSSLGYIAQVDFNYTDRTGAFLRFVKEAYLDGSIRGNHFGVGLSFRF